MDLTDIVQEARDRRDLGPVSTAALGRCMAGAALLLRLATKTPSRLAVEVRGDGPILRVLAEADKEGNLRGLVGEPRVDVPHLPNTKLISKGGGVFPRSAKAIPLSPEMKALLEISKAEATPWAKTVAWPWPWVGMPVEATTLPLTSTWTWAPS